MKLQYTFTRQFFLWGPACPQTPQRGYPPYALPHVEECTYFWGVNTSWGINTAGSKRPLNQEDNHAPQPTLFSKDDEVNLRNSLHIKSYDLLYLFSHNMMK
jgi:hypothetical protein